MVTNAYVMQRVLLLEKYYVFLIIWIFQGVVWSGEPGVQIFIWTCAILIVLGFVRCKFANLNKPTKTEKNFNQQNVPNTDGENSARHGKQLDVSIQDQPIIKIQSIDPEANHPVQRQLNFAKAEEHQEDLGVLDKIYGGVDDDKGLGFTPEKDHFVPLDDGQGHDSNNGNNFIVPVFNPNVQITEEEIPNPFEKKKNQSKNQRVISENTEGDAATDEIDLEIRNNLRAIGMGGKQQQVQEKKISSNEKKVTNEGSDEKNKNENRDYYPDKVPDHKPFLMEGHSVDHEDVELHLEKHDDLLNPDGNDAIGNIYGNENPFDESEKNKGDTKKEAETREGFPDFDIPKKDNNQRKENKEFQEENVNNS